MLFNYLLVILWCQFKCNLLTNVRNNLATEWQLRIYGYEGVKLN